MSGSQSEDDGGKKGSEVCWIATRERQDRSEQEMAIPATLFAKA